MLCECSGRFSMPVPILCYSCQAHISPYLIVKTSLIRASMEFSSGVNYIPIMQYIEFSQLSQNINLSVAKEYMVNIVCYKLYKCSSSYLLDSVIEQIELA